MKNRRTRSPLAGATVHQIAMLREMVTKIGRWERLIVKRQTQRPDFFGTKTVNGLSELTWFAERHNIAMRRATGRLMQHDDADQIVEHITLARYQQDHPAAYEVRLLRNRLTDGTLDPHSFGESLCGFSTQMTPDGGN